MKNIFLAAIVAVTLAVAIVTMMGYRTEKTTVEAHEAVVTSVEIQKWNSVVENASERRDSLMESLEGCSTKGCVLVISGNGFDRSNTLRLNGQEGKNLAVGGNVVVSYSDGGYNAGPEKEFLANFSITPSSVRDKWGQKFLTLVSIDAYGHPLITTGPIEQVVNTLFW